MSQLRFEAALRGYHLRTRVIKRHKRPSGPMSHRSGVFFQFETVILNGLDRLECDAAKRRYDRRVDQVQDAF